MMLSSQSIFSSSVCSAQTDRFEVVELQDAKVMRLKAVQQLATSALMLTSAQHEHTPDAHSGDTRALLGHVLHLRCVLRLNAWII